MRHLVLALAGGLALLLGACEYTPQTAWNPVSEYAREGLGIFELTIWLGVVIGALVEAALIWAAIRYRRRAGDRLPPQTHGNTLVEVLWTTGPVIVVGYILVVTLPLIFSQQAPAPSSSMKINVIGHQFWWEFEYPDAQVVTASELHLPVGRTINLELRSQDVIHSFWVPALGGKRDAFPGHANHIWFTPDVVGEFPGQCYQLCGFSHANMRERAVIQTQGDFETWLAAQRQPAAAPTTPEAIEGAQVFQQKACVGCHTIGGTPAQARVGPNLTHFGSRRTLAGATLDNTTANLRSWVADAPKVKPGSLMPSGASMGLNAREIDVLVAYLQSLR